MSNLFTFVEDSPEYIFWVRGSMNFEYLAEFLLKMFNDNESLDAPIKNVRNSRYYLKGVPHNSEKHFWPLINRHTTDPNIINRLIQYGISFAESKHDMKTYTDAKDTSNKKALDCKYVSVPTDKYYCIYYIFKYLESDVKRRSNPNKHVPIPWWCIHIDEKNIVVLDYDTKVRNAPADAYELYYNEFKEKHTLGDTYQGYLAKMKHEKENKLTKSQSTTPVENDISASIAKAKQNPLTAAVIEKLSAVADAPSSPLPKRQLDTVVANNLNAALVVMENDGFDSDTAFEVAAEHSANIPSSLLNPLKTEFTPSVMKVDQEAIMESLRTAIDEKDHQLTLLQSKYDHVDGELIKQSQENAQLSVMLQQLAEKSNAEKQQLSDKLAGTETALQKVQDEYYEVVQENSDMKREINDLYDQINSLSSAKSGNVPLDKFIAMDQIMPVFQEMLQAYQKKHEMEIVALKAAHEAQLKQIRDTIATLTTF
ncbi:unnamed protein product [Sphagnum jensenii]|uniref:Uncharacterized protein n=1 Tax=Sphagnum jensenii TaxID=128206 RepID=A0ABP0VA40_9BRYO